MIVDAAVRQLNVSELPQRAAPFVTSSQQRLLEVFGEAVIERPPVGADGLPCPAAAQAELPPVADGRVARIFRRTEDCSELLEGDVGEWIAGVDEELLRVVEIAHVETSCHDLQDEWSVALGALEGSQLLRQRLFAQQGYVSDAGEKRRHAGRSPVHAVLEPHTGLEAAKTLLPRGHEMAHPRQLRVAVAPDPDHSGYPALGNVGRQRRDHTSRIAIGWRRPRRNRSESRRWGQVAAGKGRRPR